MIRQLKRRYLITNMALLSCTLLVGLAILFGFLYHSAVASSYTVMQEMIERGSDPPHGKPPGEPPSDSPELPSDREEPQEGTVEPTGYDPGVLYADGLFYEPDDDSDDCQYYFEWGRWPGDNFDPPPYWDFGDPGEWQKKDDRREQDDSGQYDGRGGQQPPPQFDWDDFDDDDDDDNQPPAPPVTSQTTDQPFQPRRTETVPPFAQDENGTGRGSDPWNDPRRDGSEPPDGEFSEPPQSSSSETSSESASNSSAAQTTPAQSSAQTTGAVTTVSTSVSSSETTSALVPVDEGHYVPDAFVAQIDENGNIAAYAGNDRHSSEDEQLRIVHNAMDKVRRRGANSGTLEIGETSYRYLYQPDESGTYRLVLLGRSVELSTLSRLVFIFVLIALGGLVIMFFVSMLLANWTVTPIAVAWEKQKQFVADASHELKTPLAVISANTEVILANPKESVAEQSKWLTYIQSETMRMSKLITNLLSVARMDSGEQTEHAEPLSLSETVSNICLVFEPVIYENGKTLNSVIQRDVTMRAEEDNVKQLLSILLDNAVLHSVPKALITVSLTQDAQGKIRLAVSNTAKDIPKEQLSHLFDRFYRLDTEGSPNGSGLGLSIAKSIVHQMGGQLTVTSENQLVTFVAAFS